MLTVSNERIKTYYGLSTDTKPTKYVDNGTVFYEMDTHHYFIWDQGNNVWIKYNPNGVPVTANDKGDVTSRLKTIGIDEVVYSVDPTAGGMVDYLYSPKNNEPYLNTTIGKSTTIKQASVGTGSEMFDLFEQVYDLHGTLGYISTVDNDAGTINVITMTTGSSINDDIITTEDFGALEKGTNLKGMSAQDILIAATNPTKINNISTNAGGSINAPTALNIGEKKTITTVTPSFTVGGQGNILGVKVTQTKNSTTTTLYDSKTDTPYETGKPITLTTAGNLDGTNNTDITVILTTSGNSSTNVMTKEETISFVYTGRLYYAINSNDKTCPDHSKWINVEGNEIEVEVEDNQVIWFMLPTDDMTLQQYIMSTWSDADWYYIKYNSTYKVHCYNTGNLYPDTYKFRLV